MVLHGWLEIQRALLILEEWPEHLKLVKKIKERKQEMKRLERKFPWLKPIIKMLSVKTPCKIGEMEY